MHASIPTCISSVGVQPFCQGMVVMGSFGPNYDPPGRVLFPPAMSTWSVLVCLRDRRMPGGLSDKQAISTVRPCDFNTIGQVLSLS